MQLILGLDPGTRFTGYGVVGVEGARWQPVDHGVIAIPERYGFAQKLLFLAEGLEKLVARHKPQTTAVERVFLGKNADSAFKLGHARGICMLAGARCGSVVVEYAARSVKKVVTGSGAASKEHVSLIVGQLLGLKTAARLDATDALALAICHIRESEKEALMLRMQVEAR